jgi:hypothetical protein
LRQQPAGFALARLGESREKELGAGSAAFFLHCGRDPREPG